MSCGSCSFCGCDFQEPLWRVPPASLLVVCACIIFCGACDPGAEPRLMQLARLRTLDAPCGLYLLSLYE